MSDTVQLLDEAGRWRARDVKYWAGRWDRLREQLPTFKADKLCAGNEGPPNPYLKSIVRQPRTLFGKPIPVGVVSNSYTLAQHVDVAEKCLEGIRSVGIRVGELDCELGLTELLDSQRARLCAADVDSLLTKCRSRLRRRAPAPGRLVPDQASVSLLDFRIKARNARSVRV